MHELSPFTALFNLLSPNASHESRYPIPPYVLKAEHSLHPQMLSPTYSRPESIDLPAQYATGLFTGRVAASVTASAFMHPSPNKHAFDPSMSCRLEHSISRCGAQSDDLYAWPEARRGTEAGSVLRMVSMPCLECRC